MAYASKKLWIPGTVDLAQIAEAIAGDRAISLEQGGTGVRGTGATDQLRAEDVLKTWGMLDSGLLVPVAKLPTAVGATSSTAGTKGAVPGGAAGDQRRPYRGDATFATELELSAVTDSAGVKLIDFDKFGDGDNRLVAVAAESTSQRARLSIRSAVDANVDLQLEPKGKGRPTHLGSPLLETTKPSRWLIAQAHKAGFERFGFEAPIVQSPGLPVASLADTDGVYVEMSTLASTDSDAGVWIANATMRRNDPDLIVVFRSALLQCRFWLGLFSADPIGTANLASSGIKGAGFFFDDAAHTSNKYHCVTSDGTTQTDTESAIDTVANGWHALRVRHIASPVGTWEFSYYAVGSQTWASRVVQTNDPGASTLLGFYHRLRTQTTTQRKTALGHAVLYSE